MRRSVEAAIKKWAPRPETSNAMKIYFQLRQEEGFPPVAVESLNAEGVDDGRYRIQNTPFFTLDAAFGDVVTCEPDANGRHVFRSNEVQSGFDAISVILLDETQDGFLMDLLRNLNCVIEYGEFGELRMLAIGLPPGIGRNDAKSIRSQLDALEEQGHLSYAELVVNG